MAVINLVTKFLPYVDEMFTTESKTSLLTNKDFEFDGAKTVKVYKVSTAEMSDYWQKVELPMILLYLRTRQRLFTIRQQYNF